MEGLNGLSELKEQTFLKIDKGGRKYRMSQGKIAYTWIGMPLVLLAFFTISWWYQDVNVFEGEEAPFFVIFYLVFFLIVFYRWLIIRRVTVTFYTHKLTVSYLHKTRDMLYHELDSFDSQGRFITLMPITGTVRAITFNRLLEKPGEWRSILTFLSDNTSLTAIPPESLQIPLLPEPNKIADPPEVVPVRRFVVVFNTVSFLLTGTTSEYQCHQMAFVSRYCFSPFSYNNHSLFEG